LQCDKNNQLWRLSFSIAEVILIQSWTQMQQIVYHLLRFFAKTNAMTNAESTVVLSLTLGCLIFLVNIVVWLMRQC